MELAAKSPNQSKDRLRWGVQILLLWTLFGFGESNETYFSMINHGHSYWRIVLWCTPCWMICALMTPPILYLGKRFAFERPNIAPSLLAHLAGYLIFITIQSAFGIWLSQVVLPYQPMAVWFIPWSNLRLWTLSQMPIGLFTYATIVMAGYAFDYRAKYAQRVQREAELEALLAKAEVISLRTQLQPHFLFNTLNAIISLVRLKNMEAAEKTILHLSSMLRHSLDQSAHQEVPLSEELEFLDFYVEIERMRFSDRLTVEIDIDPKAEEAIVPSLLLQPIVENAIRHGLSPKLGAGHVWVRAWVEQGFLRLEVCDDGVGFREDAAKCRGLGLNNTTLRLQHLYGADGTLEIAPREPDGVCVKIGLPYRVTEAIE